MSLCDTIRWEISENMHPCLVCTLAAGETVVAEAGAMVWMDEDIEMETKMGDGRGRKKGYPFSGLVQAIGRKLTKQSLFMTHFRNDAPMDREIAFTGPVAGSVVAIDLKDFQGKKLICQKGAFLAAAHGTKLSWSLTKRLGAGLLGGEGWFLQELSGDGMVFLSVSGSVIRKEIGSQKTVKVDTGCLVAWSEDADVSVRAIKRIASMFFAKEGLFLASVTGPATVFIQTMPLERMVQALIAALPKVKGSKK